jgi:hypothetical protein
MSPGANTIWARSVAKFTLTCATPGWPAKARSTRPEQLAQVMPVMPQSITQASGAGWASGWVMVLLFSLWRGPLDLRCIKLIYNA